MERGFLGYTIALALVVALVSVHAMQTTHNENIIATRVAMLEQQTITNKGEMIGATFCQVTDYETWEQWLNTQSISLECGDIGPDYYNKHGYKCDWSYVKQLPENGRYLSGGEHYGILARITVGDSTGEYVIRSGTTCVDK
jgi:hypothetical protein